MKAFELEANSQNPFFVNKISKSQDSDKNENKEDIFNQFNPFSQKIINFLNLNNRYIIPDINSSNDKNSQKYINNGENSIITPDRNSTIGTNNKREKITNNKCSDNKNLNPFLVEKENSNNSIKNPYQNNDELKTSTISHINEKSNTSNFMLGTPLIKDENSINNNILPLYDDNTNELNLNMIIENSEKQIDSNSEKNVVISNSIIL